MLLNLHVKNLALIDEIEVDFDKGLNILSGETGAGKSIILGSINLALGDKIDKDIIRKGAEYALIELTFMLENEHIDKVKSMDIYPEDGNILVLSRKIMQGRSVSKINGETVSAATLKNLAPILLDIYGQHDYQSLLNPRKHLAILDSFAGEELFALLEELAGVHCEYSKIEAELNKPLMDEETRKRELDFARYEVSEIEAANLYVGEEEELADKLKVMENSERITKSLSGAEYYIKSGDENAEGFISYAGKEINSLRGISEEIDGLCDELSEIESLLSDFSRNLSSALDNASFDGRELDETRSRYDVISTLEGKYGNSIDKILKYKEEREAYLAELEAAADGRQALAEELRLLDERQRAIASKISGIRKKEAAKLEKDIMEALADLNFLQAKFAVAFEESENVTSNGYDKVSFLLSTNVGEDLRPLSSIASGGELSRIMLAIKTVSAKREEINTLIFDEIDAGISGKTAWKVSEKLGFLGRDHQIICITHLPQIASMADSHFLIEKSADNASTTTDIKPLSDDERISEIARMLGGDEETSASRDNASELIAKADNYKRSVVQ